LAFCPHPTHPHHTTTTPPTPRHAKRPQFFGDIVPPSPLFLFYTKQKKGLPMPQFFKIPNFFYINFAQINTPKHPKKNKKK